MNTSEIIELANQYYPEETEESGFKIVTPVWLQQNSNVLNRS